MGASKPGRKAKLKPEEHKASIQALLNAGTRRVEIAHLLGISTESLRVFCIKNGIQKCASVKQGVPGQTTLETFKYCDGYHVHLCKRMEQSGSQWGPVDEDKLKNLMLKTVVSCLNNHDQSRGASLKTILALGFENDLNTLLKNDEERRVGHDNAVEHVGTVLDEKDGENTYFIRPSNAPSRVPSNEPKRGAPIPRCDRRQLDGVEAIVERTRKPSPRKITRLQREQHKICPHCGMRFPKHPASVSAPNGLPPDDSRVNPCPYCFGRGDISCDLVNIIREEVKKYISSLTPLYTDHPQPSVSTNTIPQTQPPGGLTF